MKIRTLAACLGLVFLLGIPALSEKKHSRVHDALQQINLTPAQRSQIDEIVKNNPRGHRMPLIMKVLTPDQKTALRAKLGTRKRAGHRPSKNGKPPAGRPQGPQGPDGGEDAEPPDL